MFLHNNTREYEAESSAEEPGVLSAEERSRAEEQSCAEKERHIEERTCAEELGALSAEERSRTEERRHIEEQGA